MDVRERAPEGSNKARLSVKIHSSDPQSPSSRSSEEMLPLKLPSGDQSAVEPPGPIPNPEVKRCSANGSETIGLVRVGRRQVYARLQVRNHLKPGSFLPFSVESVGEKQTPEGLQFEKPRSQRAPHRYREELFPSVVYRAAYDRLERGRRCGQP